MFAAVEAPVTLQSIAAFRRDLEAREAEWLAMIAEYDRSEDWRADGFLSCAAALRSACNMNGGVAAGHVQVARKLERLQKVRTALAAGDISRTHVDVIARAATPEREDAIVELQDALVDTARHVKPRDLATVVQRVTDAIDGDDGRNRDATLHAQRRVHVSTTMHGAGVIDGQLDVIGVEIVRTALDAEMHRDRQKDETRTPSQRRHDALVNICRRALDRGEVGTSRNARPHVNVVIDLERLQTPNAPALLAKARDESAEHGHLSRATLEELTCDASISRVVMAGPSQVVDVGRATRTIPHRLWKALVARDGQCQAEGCDQPALRCQGHHKWHWTRGGPTDLDNPSSEKSHPSFQGGCLANRRDYGCLRGEQSRRLRRSIAASH